ncbi:putative disease resistance protein RGA3 [Hevea brasiliensis]|uniref:putative disease resistance protein RGA3 n=1 Tax=Hevea brasiliensis TaxID=3981 RepID=UPI0025E69A00|nr:putative disease resistance protein RGA3 [Hevea brasiliensis]
MGTPSSLPTNPNPSPSPPPPQSPPPQTPPLPQSPPPQSPPPPPSQIPPLIPPTPLSPQSEPPNETPIPDSHSPEPAPEHVPTQMKTQGKTKKAASKPKKTPVGKRKRVPSVPFDLNSPPQPSSEPVSKRTRSSSQTPTPVAQTPVPQSPLHSPAPASSADNIEENKRRHSLATQAKTEVIGREDDRKAIVDLLLHSATVDNVSVIPIVGMGGLGKTTLAQYVYNDEKVKNHFELKLWVCVSDVFDLKVIVEKMLKSIGKEPGNFELDQLQTSVRNAISGKKYMLVLDDVWNEDLQKWMELKALLMCGARGSRILVTTRSEKVAGITSGKKTHYSLKGLDLDKSWSLFKKIVFEGKEPESPNVKNNGKRIIEKCVGVPLAIKTIASLLYFRDPEREWLPFLENDLSKIAQDENVILNTLKLSYDHLSSHLKHCFAYCALFPKDYVIDVKKLIHLWAAQGFIESSNSSLCDEDIGLQYFTELWWRSFFQEVERDELGNVENCKMHDLMHELATSVAGKGICIINFKEKSVDESVRHVLFDFRLYSSQQIPAGLSNALKLRTFLLPCQEFPISEDDVSKLSISEVIVLNFRELRVCDTKIEKVSNSINRLKHLRYLDVSDNEKIVALSNSITNLQNLQVLNVSWCSSLKELPKDIKKLINLRHLYCVGCSNLTHMPRGLGQLTSLRTLTLFIVAKDNSVAKNVGGLNELNSLNNLRGSLAITSLGYVKNGIINPILKDMSLLQSLFLSSRRDDDANVDNEEMAFQNLQPHPNLKELKVYK